MRYYMGGRAYTWQTSPNSQGQTNTPKGLLSRLGLNLMTGARPIAGREQSVNSFFNRSLPAQESTQIVRRTDADHSVAKRIDYR